MNRTKLQGLAQFDDVNEALNVLQKSLDYGTLPSNPNSGHSKELPKAKVIPGENPKSRRSGEDPGNYDFFDTLTADSWEPKKSTLKHHNKRQAHWDLNWEIRQLEKIESNYSVENYRERMLKHIFFNCNQHTLLLINQ